MSALCSIGTTHPWNIAGVGLDARVCARLGIAHVTVVAGISAQGAAAEAVVGPVAPALIAAQFAALSGAGVGGYRIGALLAPETVGSVARELGACGLPVVCDPVMIASTGAQLAGAQTLAALRDQLFARCTLVTPNLDEASLLFGSRVRDLGDMRAAAQAIVEQYGAHAALIKGGHLAGEITDVLYAQGAWTAFNGARLPHGMRGTGCVLATAIAAHLIRGDTLRAAVENARTFVTDAIARAVRWNDDWVFAP